ncbi:FAD/NAD(P)-binding domain-containing protein, partial [Colletotrichum asianum]
MKCRAGPQRNNRPIGPRLVPRTARVCPYRLGHEPLFVFDKVPHSLLLRSELDNVVGLVPIHNLEHPVGLCLYCGQNGAVAYGAVGAKHMEVIGEASRGHSKIRFRIDGPFILEVLSRWSDNGEARLEGCIETGGADEDVYRVLLAVVTDAPALSYLGDLAVYHFDIGLCERLKVVHTRGETAAANAPLGD